MDENSEGEKVIIGGDFNARTERERGRIRERKNIDQGKQRVETPKIKK